MNYFIEGLDNCMKSSFIEELKSLLPEGYHILKYSSPPKGVANPELYQQLTFDDMFALLDHSIGNHNFILDRSHLGEYVYGQIYRNIKDPDYIFLLEKRYFTISQLSKMIVFYDSNIEDIIKRDDSLSLSNAKADAIDREIKLFKEAYHKSTFKTKLLVDLDKNKDSNGRVNLNKIAKQLIKW